MATLYDRLHVALVGAETWSQVWQRVQPSVEDDERSAAEPFAFAFSYALIDTSSDERRQAAGGPYAAMMEDAGWRFPPALEDLGVETLAAWVEFLDMTDSPIAHSRLHDLLWERQYGEAHLHAQSAIEGYLQLAEGEWLPTRRAFCVDRAIELSRAVNSAHLRRRAVEVAVRLTRADIATEEKSPGVALTLLRPLVQLPKRDRPSGLIDLIRETRRRYDDDPWIVESLLDLEAAVTEPESREALRREQVRIWQAAASSEDGLKRYHHLQHALALSLNHGLRAEADQARLESESMTQDELGLQTVSAEIDVPHKKIAALLDWIAQSESWQGALRRIGVQGPPTGNAARNASDVERSMREHPLLSLFPQDVLGAHSSLVFRADTKESHFRLELARHEGMGVAMFGPIAVLMLQCFADKFGVPAEDELTEHLTGPFIDNALARRCAQAVDYFWREEFDVAGHLLVPRLERAVREMCVRVGVSVTKLPAGESPGGVISLGLLLSRLEGRLDESWRRYLQHVLVDPLGLNARNDVCHGLIDQVDDARAAILIHVLLFLTTLDLS